MDKSLIYTKVARRAIRDVFRPLSGWPVEPFLATNKYAKCRTVKTYCGDTKFYNKLKKAVDAALKDAGSTDHSFKHVVSVGYFGSRTAFIVRLPREDQDADLPSDPHPGWRYIDA